MADTRVWRVPAVARCGRGVCVADVIAERPVQDRTLLGEYVLARRRNIGSRVQVMDVLPGS
jgi:hypothetical protein